MSDTAVSADPGSAAELVADLNRLLRLDHESVAGYDAAIAALRDERHRITLMRYRADHQRHILELAQLIRRYGGQPLDPRELPVGAFRWSIQAVAGLAGDREVLSAFRANEEQVLHAYRLVARAPLPADAAEVVRCNAADEERHLAWVELILEPGARMAS